MANIWFDSTAYLKNKLAQLQKTEPSNPLWQGADAETNLVQVLAQNGYVGAEGQERHYQEYGANELISPNAYFNVTEYLAAKAAQANANAVDGKTDWSSASILTAIQGAGMTVFGHFQQYGWKEGVNPSNAFDLEKYFEAKLAQLQKDEGADKWTNVQQVKDAFAAANLDPISHYAAHGKTEGVVVAPAQNPVEGAEGKTFTLTIGTDTLTGTAGNDTFVGGITLAPGTATEVNTLNNGDVLDGGAGTDTLQATLVDDSAPTLKNIENVDARFLVNAKTLSLASATGVEKVSVVNTAVAASTVSNIGAVGTFAVTNHTGANGNTVTFDNGTATKINATFTNVGVVSATAAKEINVNFDDNVFTEATIAITNSNVNLQSTTAGNDDVKTMTVVATGTNELKLTSGAGSLETLTVSGDGSLDVSETPTTVLKTLTSTAKGGVKVDATGGVLETATTGDGKDTITAVGANVKNISTGAGDDTVSIVTSALTATAVINLGAGNDKLTLSAAPTAGATLSGGEGTDTIAMAKGAYTTVSGNTDAQRALISGFEVLEITDALGAGDSIDVSKLAGVTSFTAGAGVTATETAAVTGVTSGSTVTLAGAIANNGTLNVTVKDAATGTADVLNVVLNKAIADDGNNAAVTTNAVTINLGATGVETVNLEAKGVKAIAASNDVNDYTFALTDNDLKALSVSGDQKVTFTAAAGMTKLETVDASANTAGVTINTANAALTQTITLTGTAKADTFVLGKGDVLNAGAGDDTITLGNLSKVTGGAGKDAFSVNGVVITNGNTYGSITDFTVGETIAFTDAGAYAGSATLGAKITLAGTALFADYLQAAAAGTTAGEMKWFQFSGNTYVVNDASATAAFDNGTDQIVELVGLLDLSKSTVSAAGLLTFVEA